MIESTQKERELEMRLWFSENELYSDDLHPDGTGYQSMSDLWFSSLNP